MNARKHFSQLRTRASNAALALTAGATALVVSATASAGPLAEAVTSEVTNAKSEITLVGVAILGIVGVLLLIRSVKRAAS